MKAVQINSYGSEEVLRISDIPVPSPKPGQVAVQVRAASLNPFDVKFVSGMYREQIPLSLPITPGGDFSGTVTQLGAGVSTINVGDQVYGTANVLSGGSGALAQFLVADAGRIAKKPKSVSFAEAAAAVLVGVSAVQALEEHLKLQAGQKILIHGGAGGIGHVAIQLAKAIGAFVATTVSPDDVAFVTNLGTDRVIDYRRQRFEEELKDFDAVYDTVGGETTTRSFTVLKKGGVLVSMLGQPDEQLAQKYGVRVIGQNTQTNAARLNHLATLIDAGKLKVHIDTTFPLEKIQEAVRLQQRHPRGKIVLTAQ